MTRKHPKVWWSKNKPKVDWLRIIWKCSEKYEWPSKAFSFARDQCFDFSVAQVQQTYDRKRTGAIGHAKPHKPAHPNYAPMPEELNCDDPLYDGQPVF